MRISSFLSAVALFAVATAAAAVETTSSHGISAFGTLKYPADFKHLDYVNPNAPKGGRLILRPQKGPRTFDNFNYVITRGDYADGSEFLFDTLMARAYDEPDALYGLVAESVEAPADRSFAIFNLRPEARFSDGSPLTSEDVAFSVAAIRDKGSPLYAVTLRKVVDIQVLGRHRIRFDFDKDAPTRDMAAAVAVMPIFSKAYFADRPFDEPDRGEAPLGSGPYRVGDFNTGDFVEYVRREDYWAKDLPINVGRYNFDRVRLRYFVDASLALENLTAGELDFQEEFFSLNWATRYTFAAIERGLVKKDTMVDGRSAGTQAFWLNTRREQLSDPRVREAIGLAFDFEWSNARLFYDLYTRTDSFFENTADLQAEGPITAAERALLEPFRDSLPESVFTEPAASPPVSNGSGSDRRLLRRARRLLDAAGWPVVDGKRRNAEGAVLRVEFLEIANSNFARIVNPFIANLETLGIEATLRSVDKTQYEQRFREFDYDIVVRRFVPGDTPGESLKGLLSSEAADRPGSFNVAGVKSPAIDAMIDAIIAAKSREELAVAARALDRVFRAGHYWVPNWFKGSHTVAYWDRFGRPQDLGLPKPAYNRGVIRTWWYDAEKSAAVDAAR